MTSGFVLTLKPFSHEIKVVSSLHCAVFSVISSNIESKFPQWTYQRAISGGLTSSAASCNDTSTLYSQTSAFTFLIRSFLKILFRYLLEKLPSYSYLDVQDILIQISQNLKIKSGRKLTQINS